LALMINPTISRLFSIHSPGCPYDTD
jgi:hypothetical protein